MASFEGLSVAVGQSWIQNAGMGLFATKNIKYGELICCYYGENLCTADALKRVDKSYLMRLGEQCYVDALDNLECCARYINDCRNPLCYNATFDKCPVEHLARVVAIRDIDAGEEIFVNYGKWYWLQLSSSKLTYNEVQALKKTHCLK